MRIEGLLAQVVIAIGDPRIDSIITADVARDLGLKKGRYRCRVGEINRWDG